MSEIPNPTIRRFGRLTAVAVAICALALISGCGEDTESQSSAPPETVTEEKTVTEEAPVAEEDPSEPSESSVSPSEDEGGGGGRITVPDVEGKDHQLAQDTMQAAGLYMLEEEDATGQGRALILDRNWTVVEQDPPAGTEVSEDQTITLRSKKDDE